MRRAFVLASLLEMLGENGRVDFTHFLQPCTRQPMSEPPITFREHGIRSFANQFMAKRVFLFVREPTRIATDEQFAFEQHVERTSVRIVFFAEQCEYAITPTARTKHTRCP
jgi:hypothetical protein